MQVVGRDEPSPQARRRLARPSASVPVPIPDLTDERAVESWRREIHELWGEGTVDGETAHTPGVIGGVPVLEAGPRGAPAIIVYVHGGGFCLGSPAVAIPITARLAGRLHVVSVDYRLAPRHRHPAAVEDVTRVLSVLGGQRCVLVGDSAGGWIAVHAANAAARSGDGVRGVVLLSPFLGYDGSGAGGAQPLVDAYVGPAAQLATAVPELRAPTGLLVQVGEAEPIERAGTMLDRSRRHGAAAEGEVWRHMWHTWHYHRELPEADAALRRVVERVLSWCR